jgi:hypothetical protein
MGPDAARARLELHSRDTQGSRAVHARHETDLIVQVFDLHEKTDA